MRSLQAPADITAVLRRDIATLKLKPGESLAEESLAERYEVSRTPIREALRLLEAEGFVELRGRRRVVRTLDVHEFEDIYEVRVRLEQLAVEQACTRASDRDIRRLVASWDAGDDYAAADARLHTGIAELAGNAFLLSTLQRVNDRIVVIRAVDFSTHERVVQTRREHEAILRAVQARSAPEAVNLMEAHIRTAMQNIRELLLKVLGQAYLG